MRAVRKGSSIPGRSVNDLGQIEVLEQKQTLREWLGRDRGQVALVFTDVVGSTVLANQVGDDEWIDVLKAHFAKARFYIQEHGGFEVKLIGDACMVAFHSALPALRFALDFWGDTGVFGLGIKAAVHVGEVQVVENDIYGVMINYTSRVLKAAASDSPGRKGKVVISQPAFQQATAKAGIMNMRAAFTITELEHSSLGEFPAPQRDLYQVVRRSKKKPDLPVQ